MGTSSQVRTLSGREREGEGRDEGAGGRERRVNVRCGGGRRGVLIKD